MDAIDTPEMKARVRAELIIELSPKLVAKKLGIPQSLVGRWRTELLQDAEFVAELEAYRSSLMDEALAAYSAGLDAARAIATGENAMAAAAAAKALITAPADLARAQNQLTVKLAGSVGLEDLRELAKRIDGSDDGAEGSGGAG